ncbi:MAG: hypothetical protein ABT940_13895, partial [Alphaproteobacteria bacterium]
KPDELCRLIKNPVKKLLMEIPANMFLNRNAALILFHQNVLKQAIAKQDVVKALKQEFVEKMQLKGIVKLASGRPGPHQGDNPPGPLMD